MEFDELNKSLLCLRKTDGSYYKKTSLLSIRTALNQHLKALKSSKNMSLLYFIFLNYQCNYTKTISRLRRHEYQQLLKTETLDNAILAF